MLKWKIWIGGRRSLKFVAASGNVIYIGSPVEKCLRSKPIRKVSADPWLSGKNTIWHKQ